MKLTYDPRRNIGYLRFHEKTAEVETIQLSDAPGLGWGLDEEYLEAHRVPQ